MKIEKLNDHQIRCTLTRDDLADRQLKISELAYGTAKAKKLFRDMMQQASFEFGFEAEDIPLMIEAVPLNADCLVLIITKVEDPEELDTRFSKFAPSIHEDDENEWEAADFDFPSEEYESPEPSALEDAPLPIDSAESIPASDSSAPVVPSQDVMELFQKIKQQVNKAIPSTPVSRMFRFSALSDVIMLSRILGPQIEEPNSLYKDEQEDSYILTVSLKNQSPAAFGKICNIISEYGFVLHSVPSGEYYLEEHFSPIIKDNALQRLAGLE